MTGDDELRDRLQRLLARTTDSVELPAFGDRAPLTLVPADAGAAGWQRSQRRLIWLAAAAACLLPLIGVMAWTHADPPVETSGSAEGSAGGGFLDGVLPPGDPATSTTSTAPPAPGTGLPLPITPPQPGGGDGGGSALPPGPGGPVPSVPSVTIPTVPTPTLPAQPPAAALLTDLLADQVLPGGDLPAGLTPTTTQSGTTDGCCGFGGGFVTFLADQAAPTGVLAQVRVQVTPSAAEATSSADAKRSDAATAGLVPVAVSGAAVPTSCFVDAGVAGADEAVLCYANVGPAWITARVESDDAGPGAAADRAPALAKAAVSWLLAHQADQRG